MPGALTSQALPDPETIRRTAEAVIKRPGYQIDFPEPDFSLYDAMLRLLEKLLRPFTRAVGAVFAISPVLGWALVAGLFLLLILLLVHIGWSFYRALAGPQARPDGRALQEAQILTPEGWERKAHEAAQAGDFIGAVRHLFKATLLRLAAASRRRLRRGATNRECLALFRQTPIHPPLQQFVTTIDRKWYGQEPCTAADYETCRAAYDHILQHAPTEPDHAQST